MTGKMIPSQRLMVTLLEQICAENGIRLTPLSEHWILQLEKPGRVRHIYGYNFELNSATAQLIAGDKFAAYSVLSHAGLPVIPHAMFQRPAHGEQLQIPAEVRSAIRACFEAYGQDVVCKVNPGSGGYHVHRAQTPEELDAAAERLFMESRAICLSPFVRIAEEYRLFMLDEAALLIYRKHRADGGWKHNLGLGARAEIVADTALRARLSQLAVDTVRALGIRFASVDIVALQDGLTVLEVNAGVMMESFARQGETEMALAREVYARAVQAMMA